MQKSDEFKKAQLEYDRARTKFQLARDALAHAMRMDYKNGVSEYRLDVESSVSRKTIRGWLGKPTYAKPRTSPPASETAHSDDE